MSPKKISFRQVFGEGHTAAIFRKPKDSNPYKGAEADHWNQGYEIGMQTVEFHTTAIRTKASTAWILNLED